MDISRRVFIQSTVAGGAALTAFGFDVTPVYAQAKTLKIAHTTETRSTCPYCAVSCGVIIHTLGDKAKNVVPHVVHVEGDPDHPINRGTLCPKGASGRVVNRCEGIAFTGGCTDTNEFNYLVVKAMRSMGVCYIENQARV